MKIRDKKNMRGAVRIAFVLAITSILCFYAIASVFASGGEGVYTSNDQLNGKTIGVQVGSTDEMYVRDSIPGAKLEYFNSFSDNINALKAHKIDGIANSETTIYELMKEEDDITCIEDPIGGFPCAFVFPKREDNRELIAQVNEFLAGLRESGELDRIHSAWAGDDESLKVIDDYESFPAENGTLKVLTEGAYPPYNYYRDGELVGFDIDLVVRFCKEYGYGVEFTAMNLDALVPAIESGRGDFGASGIAITEERAERVDYSDEYYFERSIVAVLKADTSSGSFFSSVKESFHKTFIQEDRYKLFVKGICNTLIITVLSVLLGTLLGFVMYLWYRRGGRPADLITRFSVWLIQGMPGVVLLMILYYVIFSSISISGIWVAVVGFTLTFGSAVYSMIISGVKAVDYGQTEASYALGFSDRQTFFGIVLPQAARHFLPAYRGEIVSLIKATAIVGYIAVQDLTKMGDIVRSRTYEAFFPLISIAIIYFVLAAILKFIVDRLTVSVDPEKRSEAEILKGVKTHE